MKNIKRKTIFFLKRIIFVFVIFIFFIIFGVFAAKKESKNVIIVFPEGYEYSVVTKKSKVSDILAETHTIVMPDEKVYPDENSNINMSKKIIISKSDTIISDDVENVSTQEILGKYATVTQKIITVKEEIPFETITKDISTDDSEKLDMVVQEGKNGIKEVKYRVKYKDCQEIERDVLSEVILEEPIEKIIQISSKVVARSGNTRMNTHLSDSTSGTPIVVTMNASAYCPCVKCTGKTNGITSSGVHASAGHTIAAGSMYPIGTKMYIPSLANSENGGWFVVEDRGGAISNNKIDIYMNSHQEAIKFGRKNLKVYVYK